MSLSVALNEIVSTSPVIEVTDGALVVLVGAAGSGKSTLARRLFRPGEIVSSDAMRALVAGDETDQSATGDAFAVMNDIITRRLSRKVTTVIDATSVKDRDRWGLVQAARIAGASLIAVVVDPGIDVCQQWNKNRDRQVPGKVIVRHHDALRAGFKALTRDFDQVVHLDTTDKISATVLVRARAVWDARHISGGLDAIGDVHGCFSELCELITKLGYALTKTTSGWRALHPEGRRLVFLGDLNDRGPASDDVLELVIDLCASGEAFCVDSNHGNKLARALAGRKVTVGHGLAASLEQLEGRTPEFRTQAQMFLASRPSHLVFDDGRFIAVHAALPEAMIATTGRLVEDTCRYGVTTGAKTETGAPERLDWAATYAGEAAIAYGHTVDAAAAAGTPTWRNNTVCVDGGAVFGGQLCAVRWPERTCVTVTGGVSYSDDDVIPVLDVTVATNCGVTQMVDVAALTCEREVHTETGQVRYTADQAHAALEVFARFAVAPAWCVFYPPTMSPASSPAPREGAEGLLEHPQEAFDHFAKCKVTEVVCETKHMGSRAVAVWANTPQAAARIFGVNVVVSDDIGVDPSLGGPGPWGVIYTRTGRPFFDDPTVTRSVLATMDASMTTSGVAGELASEWFAVDCEIMPWSAKAAGLISTIYAPVGTAATTALQAATKVVQAAADRTGSPEGVVLAAKLTQRRDCVDAYDVAWRRYCWPTEGLVGMQVAPFAVLAAEGQVCVRRPNTWQMAVAGRLAQADVTGLIVPTAHLVVDLTSPASMDAACAWWTQACAAGAEGMVVKPSIPLEAGHAQYCLKVRAAEYLRIIYGPEYTLHTERLRKRNLSTKRRKASAEWALGVESLERLVAGRPLAVRFAPVFAAAALEAELVDPRL